MVLFSKKLQVKRKYSCFHLTFRYDAIFLGGADRRGHAELLAVLVRGVSVVGLVAAAFGPAYSWLLLRLLYSTRWAGTAAPAALGAYAGYIVLLAVNGILEVIILISSLSLILFLFSGLLSFLFLLSGLLLPPDT